MVACPAALGNASFEVLEAATVLYYMWGVETLKTLLRTLLGLRRWAGE